MQLSNFSSTTIFEMIRILQLLNCSGYQSATELDTLTWGQSLPFPSPWGWGRTSYKTHIHSKNYVVHNPVGRGKNSCRLFHLGALPPVPLLQLRACYQYTISCKAIPDLNEQPYMPMVIVGSGDETPCIIHKNV